ncbi:MAG TPA: FAD/NAD(P)-binding oxidoreductase [Acidobacteriaceae bacterium]|nr:FAD/NAD(P)-binding oxidoreductase [Acidobacteriaceae bacterium]
MRQLLILGGGTAGTMMANKLARVLDEGKWQITLVDATEEHYYQPGFLLLPFGTYRLRDLVKPRRQYLPPQVKVIISAIDHIDAAKKTVTLGNRAALKYDYLIVATGADIHPEQTEGLLDEEWGRSKFDFYTPKGAERLGAFLKTWQGGKLVVSITEMPIKCPVAPLEFLFLADAYFTERGMRDKVELQLATPLSGAFTKPTASRVLGSFLEQKNISVVSDFGLGRVDSKEKKLIAWDDTEVSYDALVSIPTNMGDASIARSGMGNELNFIPTNKETLQAEGLEDVFVIGDATNLPSSKAGSVAHFQSEILFENFLEHAEGRPMPARYDGHTNCFIESGFGKGLLIDFNYATEPLQGEFPLPGVGPFSLLKESPVNHYGKLMFRWFYWNMLLRGMELPIGTAMSMAGKRA